MGKIKDAKPPTEATFGVILEPANAGGRRAVGDMLPGRAYQVPATECLRLVELKGFTFVAAADADAAKAEAKRYAAALAEFHAAAAAITAE
jgi:hypothetical protein